MSATIDYNGSTVATISSGEKATLPVENFKMATDIVVTAIKDTPKLQIKNVTPTKENISVEPDSNLGYEGLSKVTVAAIPDKYIDTTNATAVAGDILTGKTAYVNGEYIPGAMPDNGYSSDYYTIHLDVTKTKEDLYGAYNGKAEIYLEELTVTENDTYEPKAGHVISKVTVNVQVPVWDGTKITVEPA